MSEQIRAILWAQFRAFRNHLPRTGAGTVFAWLLSLGWYSLFGAIAFALAESLPTVPARILPFAVSVGLLCIFLFWQTFPLMTLSSGASLDLSKLLIYPVRKSTLFAVEVLLRVTTAPEMIIVLCGGIAGLLRHPDAPALGVLWLLIYIPLNLFSSLALREWMVSSFERKHLKYVFVILFLALSVLPNLVLNTGLGQRAKPVFIAAATLQGMPWHEASLLATSGFQLRASSILIGWIALSYVAARRTFVASLASDRVTFRASRDRVREPVALSEALFRIPGRLFSDPFAAILEKELRILTRSPRFRVVFGIACIFSAVVFVPFSSSGNLSNGFVSQNYLPTISLYGMLIIGEVLLWNNLGFDRKAAQLYFVAPVPFAAVIHAKNAVACIAIAAMSAIVTLAGALLQRRVTAISILTSLSLTAVLTLYFLAFGNLSSVMMPRPINPGEALKKQKSAKSSLWLLLSVLVLIIPLGLAFTARWAFDSEWAFFGVLGINAAVGVIVYGVATSSAIERASREREQILEALSTGSDPIG